MPNLLAHIGVHLPAGRGLFRGAPLPWLLLGCVLPDAGWILQRAVRWFPWAVDPYELRLYAIAQSSLLLCLVLAAGLAALATRPLRVFALLGLSAALHLVLDATQIKLANGVHLLAPFSWELFRLDLYWPDSAPTYALTALGLGVFAYGAIRWRSDPVDLSITPTRAAAAAAFAILWLVLPLALRAGPEAADNHAVATLRAPDRTGLHAGFDRNRYRASPEGDVLVSLAGEPLRVVGRSRGSSGTVSAHARFVSHDRIEILSLHEHPRGGRDLPTYLGLLLVLFAWLRPGAVRLQGPAAS